MFSFADADSTEEYLRDINEILTSGLSAVGAYSMGAVTYILRTGGRRLPDRALLERASKCQTVREAVELAREALQTTPSEAPLPISGRAS